MSPNPENKTTSEFMVIIYIVNCIVMEGSEIAIKVANTLATFWSMKKQTRIKDTQLLKIASLELNNTIKHVNLLNLLNVNCSLNYKILYCLIYLYDLKL